MKKRSRRKNYKQHNRLGNKGRKEECNNFFSKIIKHLPQLHDSSHKLVYFCYSGNQAPLESSSTRQGGKSAWGQKSGSNVSVIFIQADTHKYICNFYEVFCGCIKCHSSSLRKDPSTHLNKTKYKLWKDTYLLYCHNSMIEHVSSQPGDSSVDHRFTVFCCLCLK